MNSGVLTSRDCDIVSFGFVRSSYKQFNVIPSDIIYLIAAFLNLWQHIRVIGDQLKSLQENEDTESSDLHVQHKFSVDDQADKHFEISIRRLRSDDDIEKISVGVVLSFPSFIIGVGGYFQVYRGLDRGQETREVDFDGVENFDSVQDLEDLCVFGMTVDEFKNMTELTFSYLIDIRQIKYEKYINRENIDWEPPMFGYGRKQWEIVVDSMEQTEEGLFSEKVKEKGWELQLICYNYSDPLHGMEAVMIIDNCDANVNVWSFNLKCSVKILLKRNGELIKSSFRQLTGCGDWYVLGHFATGVTKQEVLNAERIDLDVFWEIVSVRDEEDAPSRTDWDKLRILMPE